MTTNEVKELVQEPVDPFDLGWAAGYNDEYPECPFPEDSTESVMWWDGYNQGSQDC